MSCGPKKVPVSPPNGVAISGMILSAIALAGWVIMLAMIFKNPYQAYSKDGLENMFIGLSNFENYLSRVLVGVVGMLINGGLSMAGTITSAVTLKYEPRQRNAIVGLGLGALGLFLGAGVLVWRFLFWAGVLNG